MTPCQDADGFGAVSDRVFSQLLEVILLAAGISRGVWHEVISLLAAHLHLFSASRCITLAALRRFDSLLSRRWRAAARHNAADINNKIMRVNELGHHRRMLTISDGGKKAGRRLLTRGVTLLVYDRDGGDGRGRKENEYENNNNI